MDYSLFGWVGAIGGMAINGHLPGGPAMPIIVTAMIIGITGLPNTDHP